MFFRHASNDKGRLQSREIIERLTGTWRHSFLSRTHPPLFPVFVFFFTQEVNKCSFDHAKKIKKKIVCSRSRFSDAHFFSSSFPTQQSESWGGYRCTLSSSPFPSYPLLVSPSLCLLFSNNPPSVHPPPLSPCYGWSHLPSTLWTSRSVESRPWSCTYPQGTPSLHLHPPSPTRRWLIPWHTDTLTPLTPWHTCMQKLKISIFQRKNCNRGICVTTSQQKV